MAWLAGVRASCSSGHAAVGIELVLARLRRVQNVRRVGKDDGLGADLGRQGFDLADVARFDPAGNQVDRLSLLLRRLGEVVDHAPDHVGEAGDVRADVAGRVGVDDPLARGNLSFVPRLGDDLGDVVADGLREAGRVDGDHVGIVDGKDVGDGLQQVGLAAEHRRALGEGTGRGHDRLLVVPGQRAAVVRAAALRAVAVRQAIVDPQGRVHGADRLAGLRRIDRQRLALGDFGGRMSQEHGRLLLRYGRTYGGVERGPPAPFPTAA